MPISALCLLGNRCVFREEDTRAQGSMRGSKVERVEVTASGVVSTGSITGL
jgi:hypothetical protein